MVFTIEPMINAGLPETRTLPDRWTITTRDGSLSAQFEHTIAITEGVPEILTLP
jgi:methionyl aminopeptidase